MTWVRIQCRYPAPGVCNPARGSANPGGWLSPYPTPRGRCARARTARAGGLSDRLRDELGGSGLGYAPFAASCLDTRELLSRSAFARVQRAEQLRSRLLAQRRRARLRAVCGFRLDTRELAALSHMCSAQSSCGPDGSLHGGDDLTAASCGGLGGNGFAQARLIRWIRATDLGSGWLGGWLARGWLTKPCYTGRYTLMLGCSLADADVQKVAAGVGL